MASSSTFSKISSLQSQTETLDSARSSRSTRRGSLRSMSAENDITTSKPPKVSRRPRRSSPTSMYGSGMYDTSPPKPPKPLIRLEKKSKAPARPATAPNPPRSPVALLFGCRRGTTPLQSSSVLPAPMSIPVSEKQPYPTVIERPARRSHASRGDQADWNIPGSVSSSMDGPSSLGEENFDDEYLEDDLHYTHASPPPSPIHFASPSRPPSVPPRAEPYPRAQAGKWTSEPIPGSRPNTPFADPFVAVNSHILGRGEGIPAKSWIGEWNQQDMQEVIGKLRLLK